MINLHLRQKFLFEHNYLILFKYFVKVYHSEVDFDLNMRGLPNSPF